MLQYEVPPELLRPLVPRGTELESWQGRTVVSLVGLRFLATRLLGAPIPWHRNFEELNLRFYVRRQTPQGWRRAVVFVREVVPRRAVALVARLWYNEPYVALPMRHRVALDAALAGEPGSVCYEWLHAGRWHRLEAETIGRPALVADGSEEAFVTEHYWGYTVQRDGGSLEYEVAHPRWRVWQTSRATLDCDVARLYGPAFAEPLSGRASSGFVAEGSAVTVFRGRRLPAP